MGIKGLYSTLKPKFKKTQVKDLQGCYILVDAPNFAHNFSNIDGLTTQDLLTFKENLVTVLNNLQKLSPCGVEFIFDGALPRTKQPIRIQRGNQKLGLNCKIINSLSTNLLLELVSEQFPQYTVKIFGEEADDVIAYEAFHLQDKVDQILILSNDSDTFTYYQLKENVLVDPLLLGDWFCESDPVVYTLSVTDAHSIIHFNDRKRIRMPVKSALEPKTSPNGAYLLRQHELINTFHNYGFLRIHLPVLTEHDEHSAWKVGQLYRSFSYTLLLRPYYKAKRIEESVVNITEYYPSNRKIRNHQLAIFRDRSKDEDYYNYEEELLPVMTSREDVIDDLIREIIESPGYGNDLKEDDPILFAVRCFLNDVMTQKVQKIVVAKEDDKFLGYIPGQQIYLKVVTALYSLKLLNSVWKIPCDEEINLAFDQFQETWFKKYLVDQQQN